MLIAGVGIQVVVLGVGIVSLVLGVLIGFIYLMEILGKNKRITPYIPELKSGISQDSQTDDSRLTAVITAAIYAIISTEQNTTSNLKFVVRSIRRI